MDAAQAVCDGDDVVVVPAVVVAQAAAAVVPAAEFRVAAVTDTIVAKLYINIVP